MSYILNDDATFTLSNGTRFPAIGYGTFQLRGREETAEAVRSAIAAGYRLIDTAADYGNEEGVGDGVRTSEVPRSEVLVSSKVWPSELGYDRTMRAFEASLGRLGLEYLDFYLIHWPCSEELNAGSWKAFEELHEQGLVKTPGVSNFTTKQLEPLLASATVPPLLDQLEYHPYFFDRELQEYCADHGILVEAWSPLMQGAAFSNETLGGIGVKHGRTAAQVALRWSVQMGAVPLPKTRTPERMIENKSIFDFELDRQDMADVSALFTGVRLGPDPDTYHFCK